MPLQLTAPAVRAIFPSAPQAIIDSFVARQGELDRVGITDTRNRLAICLSQLEHECGGFTIPNLTENINYSPERAAQIWPGRHASAAAVRAKYGTAPGWQKFMFDDVYGGRMGNRPGTHDGSKYIGRGGPQITGRDGYDQVGRRAGLPLVAQPELATLPENQPAITAGFWSWKNLNPVADTGGLRGVTRIWNGGYIGMADREAKMRGNEPIVARLEFVERIKPLIKDLPGEQKPIEDVVAENTKKERATRNVGTATGAGGVAGEAGNATTEQPLPVIPPLLTYTAIGLGVAIVIVAAILIARKRSAVVANWF